MHAHIKEQPLWFRRFAAIWTPTVMLLDADGVERWRMEGYLPNREFHAHLEMGFARLVAVRKRWLEAEPRYVRIIETFPETSVVPEAIYWRGICAYRRTNDHAELDSIARELALRFPATLWAIKASVWST